MYPKLYGLQQQRKILALLIIVAFILLPVKGPLMAAEALSGGHREAQDDHAQQPGERIRTGDQ